jgi:hypothetical protein
MTALDRLLAQLEKRGLGVKPGAEPGQLLLTGPAAEKTPEVVAAVKAFKPQLLEWVARRVAESPPPPPAPEPGPTVCRECGANWWVPAAEIREAVNRGPHYCGQSRCPFRDREGGRR